jgi:hypothetical protein
MWFLGKEDFLKVIAYHKMIQQTSDEEDISLFILPI